MDSLLPQNQLKGKPEQYLPKSSTTVLPLKRGAVIKVRREETHVLTPGESSTLTAEDCRSGGVAMNEHASLRFRARHWIAYVPPALLIRDFNDHSGTAADEKTAAHAFAENKLCKAIQQVYIKMGLLLPDHGIGIISPPPT